MSFKHPGREITPLPDRFWAKVNKTATCWLWTGGLGGKRALGYGRFPVNNKLSGKYRVYLAHRLSWELLRGPIPADKQIDHLCRVRHCVNPDHLELVSIKENVLRGIGPTAINKRKTHCKHGHLYTPENTKISKKGRSCRECSRIFDREHRRLRKSSDPASH